MENIQVIYKSIPNGIPKIENFKIRTTKPNDSLCPGEILLRTLYISIDPYLRGRMRDPNIESYLPAFTTNDIMQGELIGQVVKSMNSDYSEGEILKTFGKWEEYAVINPNNALLSTIKIKRENKFPLSYYLGILGSSGLTAYIGLHKICEPFKPHQTLLVSAALGGVGQIVGQYAKVLGLDVVGSVGDNAKAECLVNELGFDAAFNYKNVSDLSAKLAEVCPNGIDIYFDNVGGEMLEAALLNCNLLAKIVISGQISQYNKLEADPLKNFNMVLAKRFRIEGFSLLDGTEMYSEQCWKTFKELLENQKIKYKEHFTNGIQIAPQAFIDLLNGKNYGKSIIVVADLN